MDYHANILKKVHAIFDRPIISNTWRGKYLEFLIGEIAPEWRVLDGEWEPHDLEHEDGTSLQVKQSSHIQTWSERFPETRPAPSFKIDAKKRDADGRAHAGRPKRLSEIFVFGVHDIFDESADHRDPSQWKFYVLPEFRLPVDQKSISLGPLRRLAEHCNAGELREGLDLARRAVRVREAQSKVEPLKLEPRQP